MSPRHWWLFSSVLVGIGLALTSYLLGRAFALLSSTGPHTIDLCSALFATSCDAALTDPRSWFLRVPMAGWGLVYFTTLGSLLFLARFMKRAFEAEAILAATLVALAGVALGLELVVSALLAGVPICPLCFAIHGISLLLLVALRRASGQSISEQRRLFQSAAKWFLQSGTATPESVRWKFVGFASVALLAAMTYQWVYVESALRRPSVAHTPRRSEVIAAYRSSPQLVLPVTEQDPHLGPLTAPVRLVVFESLRCPGCRNFAGTLPRLRNRFRDRLLVVYKHYPLSTQCNERLTRDMQPGSCEAAWAAQAAHRQARFWPFHDAMLAAGTDGSQETIAEAVRRLKLDPARFAADRQSDSIRERVAEDIALGNRLKIPGTPAVFLDGRLVSSASAEILEILIQYELGQHVAGSARGHDIMGGGRPGNVGRS